MKYILFLLCIFPIIYSQETCSMESLCDCYEYPCKNLFDGYCQDYIYSQEEANIYNNGNICEKYVHEPPF